MVAELIAIEGALKGLILSLERGGEWVLGRDPDQCHLVIEDPKAERRHLICRKTEEGYLIENLSETAPILLNGEALVDAVILMGGDRLQVGETVFEFYPEGAPGTAIFTSTTSGIEHPEEFSVDSSLDLRNLPGTTESSEEWSRENDAEISRRAQEWESVKEEKEEFGIASGQEWKREPSSAKDQPKASDQGWEGDEEVDDDWGEVEEEIEEMEVVEGEGATSEILGETEEMGHEGRDEKKAEEPTIPSEEMSNEGRDQRKPKKPAISSEEMSHEGRDEKKAEELIAASEEMSHEGAEKLELPTTSESEQLFREEGEDSIFPIVSDTEAEQSAPAEEWTTEEIDREAKEEAEHPQDVDIPRTVEPKKEPQEEFHEEGFEEESLEEEPLFEEEELSPQISVDLTPSVRFLLKVIAGPNTGAEFALDMGREYTIGTDTTSCDIVFHDLSVSREHARLKLSEQGILTIEDLGSRNGVVIDQEQVSGSVPLKPNLVVSLGTSAFFIIDRDAPQETIITPAFEQSKREKEEVKEEVEEKEEREREEVAAKAVEPSKPKVSGGTAMFVSIVVGLAILLGIGTISLFQTKELEPVPKNYMTEIKEAVQDFPGVKFTYNVQTKKLFLVGHVSTGVEKNELFYNLNGLPFLKGVEDNVVNDEAVWQEMNILLSKISDFKGVSMHSPRPAVFVLNGYLKTEKQAADLTDYMNIHFNYLNLLENRVIVDQQIVEEISSELVQKGFGAVAVAFASGELTFAGYVSSSQAYNFQQIVDQFKQTPGVRQVQNYVVIVAPEEQVINLNQRYPGRYNVTGYSKHGNVSINVVVNGKILSRGDVIDGMTLMSIQPNSIFFEKDGLKYKLEYNK
ncbi:MAG: type III secretion system inner membrane ring subunit SctD, partial [Chlamydiales bacterium]